MSAGHVAKFVDEICGNGMHVRWPLPWPAPAVVHRTLSGADLIVMGTQFQQSAVIAMDRDLGRTFADAAHALLEAGSRETRLRRGPAPRCFQTPPGSTVA